MRITGTFTLGTGDVDLNVELSAKEKLLLLAIGSVRVSPPRAVMFRYDEMVNEILVSWKARLDGEKMVCSSCGSSAIILESEQ